MANPRLKKSDAARLGIVVVALSAVSGCGGGGGASLRPNALQRVASFTGANGSSPQAVRFDSHGNLFGVAASGGANGDGDVFEVAAGSSTIVDVADFDGANGSDPITLLVDSTGDVFGVAQSGGASGNGDVFEMTAGSHSIVDLADFTVPTAVQPSLVIDSHGNLFGIVRGGASAGYVFEVAANSHTITSVATFNTAAFDFGSPDSLVIDSHDNLFGTVSLSPEVLVFEVAAGSSVATLQANLGISGAFPDSAHLAIDGNNDLFGTTGEDGQYGDVFELPNESVPVHELAFFNLAPDGSSPPEGPNPTSLTVDNVGDVFGTTFLGGVNDSGMVFEVAAGSSTIRDLADMPSAPTDVNGSARAGSLVADGNGNLFGVTGLGGPANRGTVFEVPMPR